MNYNQALEYIHSINWTFCKPGLERIAALCKMLGDPQNDLNFIHVAGTNGKGSFSAMTESILRAAGYTTGLFTSPYVKVFNERMAVNGKMISDDELAEITSFVKPFADSMADKPTEFELITAIALLYFKRHGCEVVVFEAGMGGRLDSTNVISRSLLSVITGIALDHTAFLGDTVEKIAFEKAGIIKEGCPLLYGGTDESAKAVIRAVADERNAPFYTVDRSRLNVKEMTLSGTIFDFNGYTDLKIKLLGKYQPENASTVLSAVEILKSRGFNIPESAVKAGLLGTVWPARFEIIGKDPLVIFDGAHNPQGIDAAVESIKLYFPQRKQYVLTGVLKDKDYLHIASRLSEIAEKAFVLTPENPRALPGDQYAAVLSGFGVDACAYQSTAEAFKQARLAAKQNGVALICLGSLYTYASL